MKHTTTTVDLGTVSTPQGKRWGCRLCANESETAYLLCPNHSPDQLRAINKKLLAALEEALAHADRWHGEGQSGEGRRCTSCIEFQPGVRTAIKEAKK